MYRTSGSRGATDSSFRGGGIFMKFHSMTSSCFFNRGTTFSQTVTYKVLFATFPKMRTFQFEPRCRPNDQDRVKISSLIQTPQLVLCFEMLRGEMPTMPPWLYAWVDALGVHGLHVFASHSNQWRLIVLKSELHTLTTSYLQFWIRMQVDFAVTAARHLQEVRTRMSYLCIFNHRRS